MSASVIQYIELDKLVPHPQNPRDDMGNPQALVELANSIAANGNTALLRVVPISSGKDAGKFLLIEGHRRTAAARLGNVETLQCIIDPTLDTLAKQLAAMLRENTHREGITLSHEAKAIQTMLDCPGMSVKKVAKEINRGETFIRQRSRLAHAPEVAHQLVDGGGLTLEQSEAFDEFKDDDEATKDLILTATSPYFHQNDWVRTLRTLRARRDAPAKSAKAAVVIEQIGAQVITEGQADSGHYDRDYSSEKLTAEEHAEKGHFAHVSSSDGELRWYKRSATAVARKPLTDDEREEKQKLKDITAGLEIDLAIWDDHLRASLTDAGGGLPLTAVEKQLQSGLAARLLEHYGHYERAAQLLLNKSNHLGLGQDVRLAVEKLRPLQLVMLRVELKCRPENLHKSTTWNTKPSVHRGEETDINRWIRVRKEVFDYEESVFERKAISHFQGVEASNHSDIHAEEETDDAEA